MFTVHQQVLNKAPSAEVSEIYPWSRVVRDYTPHGKNQLYPT